MRIYLAGPLGFSEAGRYFQKDILIPRLKGLGHEVINPFDLTDHDEIQRVTDLPWGPGRREAWDKLNPEIGRRNALEIANCDAVVAILDGPDVDSGTASEIGFAYGRGKTIFGYRGDFRLSADNESLLVNLQVEFFIRESGGTIVTSMDDLMAIIAETKA